VTDLTTRVLIEIRDEIKATRTELAARLDETNTRIDRTNQHLERLEHRVASMDLRLTTDIAELTRAFNDEVLFGHRELRKRMERCERDIDELKRR
jgi:chromosome segregation ATPase